MLTSLLQGAPVDEQLAELILEKSEGVPFFIEELVKSLTESSAIEVKDDRWTLKTDARQVHVPNTVEELLTARIDRLPEAAKRVLQIGSVIGREFSWELLKPVADTPDLELIAHLSALKDAELIYERGIHPQTTYIFKHAFTQEVAYESLLLAARRQLHQQIGEIILAQHGDNLDEWTGILAHHFAHSSDAARALLYLAQTGHRALRVYANVEALRAFTQAMEILDSLSPTDATRRQRAELSMRLESLHALLGGAGYWESGL